MYGHMLSILLQTNTNVQVHEQQLYPETAEKVLRSSNTIECPAHQEHATYMQTFILPYSV
jgi:hypothetical protein